MRKIILFFLLLFLSFNSLIFAQNNNLTYLLKKLHCNYDNVTSFKADFVQYSYFKSINSLQKFEGILYLKKPDKMRWDYIKPEMQSIISNGVKIWYYYPDENQVNVGKLSKQNREKNLIFMFLSNGISRIEKDFKLKLISGKDNKNFFYLELIPKIPNTTLEKIILTIDKKDLKIKVSHVYNPNGDIVKVILKNEILNYPCKDNLFIFITPPGTEVYEIPSMQ